MIAVHLLLTVAGWGADPTPAVDLVPSHVPGRTSVYRVRTETVGLQDGEQTVQGTTEFVLEIKTLSTDESGARLRARFRRASTRMSLEDGVREFDTAATPAEAPPKEFAAFAKLPGSEFHAQLDTFGGIRSMSSHRAGGGAAGPADILGANEWTRLLRILNAWRPRKSVRPGDSWSHGEDFDVGLVAGHRRSTLTLRGVDELRALIESRIDIENRDSAQASESGISSRILPGPPGSARIVFDRVLGLVTEVEASLSLTIETRSPKTGVLGLRRPVSRQEQRSSTRIRLLSIDGQPYAPPQARRERPNR